MATVVELYAAKGRQPLWVCDFSPPRSGNPAFTARAKALDVDFFSVAYSPGQSVRMDTVAAAATLKRHTGKEVIFNVATRDMNRLALQMHLLGAQALEVENILIVRGDNFTESDQKLVKTVADYKPTELMDSIRQMNLGIDFRGKKLRHPTNFCIGAIVDPHREVTKEAALAQLKLESGATYLITQSVFDPAPILALKRAYQSLTGKPLALPLFCGVQIMSPGGVTFGAVPAWVARDLSKGRSGVEMAIEVVHDLLAAGCDAFYLVPPILKGGRRDYEALQAVVSAVRSGSRPVAAAKARTPNLP